MLPNRLIFPANPGGGRSPSHDHDGLEARLGNDHATSRPSLLPTKQPRNPRFYETLSCLVFRRIFRRILSLSDRSSSIILRSIIILSNISLVANFFDDCLRRCFRVFQLCSMGEVRRKADESNSLSSSPRKITIEDEDKS